MLSGVIEAHTRNPAIAPGTNHLRNLGDKSIPRPRLIDGTGLVGVP
tara:strand:- start:116 stop:253 length:138 start_codon:yes stop_codon:yes gene_type:complete